MHYGQQHYWGLSDGALSFLLIKTLIPDQVVIASFVGACVVGFLGMYFAHRVHTPPMVFTIPAVMQYDSWECRI